jgi:hypothetical protein
LSQGNSKLTISGNNVITSGMEVGISFAPGGPGVLVPCPKLAVAGSPPPPSPCTATVATLPSGVATKLTVDGLGALLDGANGQTINPNDPAATWSVASAGQTLLKAS